MKPFHEPISTLYRSFQKTNPNQKVLKKSDIKLNDVLINGVKLRCFQTIKHNRISINTKYHHSHHQSKDQKQEEIEQVDENTLFKNKAIKRRLRSLQNDAPTITTAQQSSAPRKPSIRIKQICKVPIQILNPTSREKKYSGTFNQHSSFKFIDINNQYYNQLKKDLLMYTTNSRFNSTMMKSKMKYGKYIGLQMKRQKRVITHRQSNLIKENVNKYEDNMISNRYARAQPTRQRFYTSLDEKEENQELYHNTINDEREWQSLGGSNHKLKICYSTKNDFKRWKDIASNQSKTLETARSTNPQKEQTQLANRQNKLN